MAPQMGELDVVWRCGLLHERRAEFSGQAVECPTLWKTGGACEPCGWGVVLCTTEGRSQHCRLNVGGWTQRGGCAMAYCFNR